MNSVIDKLRFEQMFDRMMDNAYKANREYTTNWRPLGGQELDDMLDETVKLIKEIEELCTSMIDLRENSRR